MGVLSGVVSEETHFETIVNSLDKAGTGFVSAKKFAETLAEVTVSSDSV